MTSFYDVLAEDLERLDAKKAVEMIRHLLVAEAPKIGVPISRIDVNENIDAKDGGVDATVTGGIVSKGNEIIFDTLTSYQIKTGHYEKTEDHVGDILFNSKGVLKPRVKACLDNNGTLVFVFFGKEKPDEKENQFKNIFLQLLTKYEAKYADAKIVIWRQNQLISLFQSAPTVVAILKDFRDANFLTIAQVRQKEEFRSQFQLNESQNKFIADMRSFLETDKISAPQHLRILGEPGIGKSRLALESLSDQTLEPLVLFFESPSRYRDERRLYNQLTKSSEIYSIIIVIDECNNDDAFSIWGDLKNLQHKLVLITIFNQLDERDRESPQVFIRDAPTLDDDAIKSILTGADYNLPPEEAGRWGSLCEGSPRVAHTIGWNFRQQPSDILGSGNPNITNVWRRFVAGRTDNQDSPVVRQRLLVLRFLSLFRRFGYETPYENEAEAIRQLIKKIDGAELSWSDYAGVIKDFRQRKILQGDKTLYITPKALHLRMWTEWWELYKSKFNLETFSDGLPPKLDHWFSDMVFYAKDSSVAGSVADELLSLKTDGNESFLKKKLNSKIIYNLAKVEPEKTLDFIVGKFGRHSKEELSQATDVRRDLVWALQYIVAWKDHFEEGADFLMKLAAAENESWANNASGVFKDLFYLHAQTEESYERRFDFLLKALESDRPEIRKLAITGLEAAITISYSISLLDFSFTNRPPIFWTVKTEKEFADNITQAWKKLENIVGFLREDDARDLLKAMISRSRSLMSYDVLESTVLQGIRSLAKHELANKKEIMQTVTIILKYDAKKHSPEFLNSLEELKSEITGHSFKDKLARYAGMNIFTEHAEDEAQKITITELESLAKVAMADPTLLEPELKWLTSREAQNGFQFGYQLGKVDTQHVLLSMIVERHLTQEQKGGVFFFSGYLLAVREASNIEHLKIIHTLSTEEKFLPFITELVWRSGVSDDAVGLLINLLNKEKIKCNDFQYLAMGNVINKLSGPVFHDLVRQLLKFNDIAASSIALELINFYYVFNKEPEAIPVELFYLVVSDSPFFKPAPNHVSNMLGYNWNQVARKLLGTSYADKLIEKICDAYGTDSSIFESHSSEGGEFLEAAMSQHGNKIWTEISKRLSTKEVYRGNSYRLARWLAGKDTDFVSGESKSMLDQFPHDTVFTWIDQDKNERIEFAATYLMRPLWKLTEGDISRKSIEISFLERYGASREVRSSIMSAAHGEGWSGPTSLYLTQKQEKLLSFKQLGLHPNVEKCIDEYVGHLTDQIAHAYAQEERDDFR